MTTRLSLLVVLSVLASLLAVGLPPATADGEEPPAEIDPNRVKAKFTSDPPADLDVWAQAHGWKVELRSAPLDLAAFSHVEGLTGDQFLQALREREDVVWASFDGIVRTQHVRAPLVPNPPTDPRWGGQPDMRQIGLGIAGGLNDAWDYERGRTDATMTIIVAVLDTGVHAAHEDLVTPATPYCTAPNNYDVHGHGTHVAGTVAAEANNGRGIAGVAQVKIACFKALTDAGYGWYSQTAAAIMEAAALHGPTTRVIVSMSLGGGCYSGSLYLCADMEEAVDLATRLGLVIVAASGNNYCVGSGCVLYPARYPAVVAVGSIGAGNARSGFSNGGPELDVVAPGENVLSTAPPVSLICAPNYCSISGTSMATPHVSGVAALVWSHCPHLTRGQVVNALLGSADDLGAAGWDSSYGWGRVDPTGALHAQC